MVKEEKIAKVLELPTTFTRVVELPDGRQVSFEDLLVEIYNDVQQIKKQFT